MGKKGREIVNGDVKKVLEDLKRAYCDEWQAHYHYWVAAILARGLNAPEIAEALKVRSTAELGHAEMIAQRMLQLGGEPPRTMEAVPGSGNYTKFHLPSKASDLKGILKAVLQAERSAIETYQTLAQNTREGDIVTHELAEDLLTDEVKDEEETENLLGE